MSCSCPLVRRRAACSRWTLSSRRAAAALEPPLRPETAINVVFNFCFKLLGKFPLWRHLKLTNIIPALYKNIVNFFICWSCRQVNANWVGIIWALYSFQHETSDYSVGLRYCANRTYFFANVCGQGVTPFANMSAKFSFLRSSLM